MASHLLVSSDSDLCTINCHGTIGVDTTVLLAGKNKIDQRGPGKLVPSCGWNQISSIFLFMPLCFSHCFVYIFGFTMLTRD